MVEYQYYTIISSAGPLNHSHLASSFWTSTVTNVIHTNPKGQNLVKKLGRESISANINLPEVVEGSSTELYKGTRGRVVVA